MDWLQYLTNPYALTAVIALVLGSSLRYMIKAYGQKHPGYVLASYALFLLAIVSLGIGALATSYYLAGTGAEDPVAYHQESSFSFIPTAYADAGHGHYGWVWAGEMKNEWYVPYSIMAAVTISGGTAPLPEVGDVLSVSNNQANLRSLPPKFSWWRLRYVLGDLLEVLEPATSLRVQRVHEAGKQVWLQVEVMD